MGGLLFTAVAFLAIFAPLCYSAATPRFDALPFEKRSQAVDKNDLYQILNTVPKEANIQSFTRYYATGAHLAGKNYSQAVWTKQKWEEYGIQSEIVPYDVYLNYPIRSRFALLKKTGPDTSSYTTLYEAKLEEDVLPEDPTTGWPGRIPSFHGYSASGNVTGQLVYANYGTLDDYQYLISQGISLKGKVVLVKYGKIFRGLKVERAQDLGAVGVVMYSDPGDDGKVTEKNGYKPYPQGPARQPSAVQKGSVEYLSTGVGDPTTPGYASKPGVKRENPDKYIPKIPSIPLSYTDAIPFLKALEGQGLDVSKIDNKDWQTGGLDYKGVKYFTGPSNTSIAVNLLNEQEYVTTPVWNVIGTIPGTLKDELVMIGNHRDSWSIGGAIDPNGASACLVELARTLQAMRQTGWVPRRTIMLASWDAEEYGIIGSTEWVEEFAGTLKEKMVAYLNMDGAPLGATLAIMGHPLLNNAIEIASKRITNVGTGKSIFDSWDKYIMPIGAGSDFTAFQGTIGIPSLDFTFDGDYEAATPPPIYHYHSNYDSIAWAEKYADPGYKFHAMALKFWGALLLEVTETPTIVFKVSDYATTLREIVEDLSTQFDGRGDNSATARSFKALLEGLKNTIGKFADNATKMDNISRVVLQHYATTSNTLSSAKFQSATSVLNTALLKLDRSFIYDAGLDNRTFYKHVINAPSRTDGYYTALMPGLVESIEDKNWANGNRWADIISGCINNATKLLEGAISSAQSLGVM